MSDGEYSLKYRFTMESKKRGFKREDAGEDEGLADALVLVSIIRGGDQSHDGPKSIAIVSRDGFISREEAAARPRGWNVPDTELFQVMAHIAAHLAEDEGVVLPDWSKAVAQDTIAKVRSVMSRVRDLLPWANELHRPKFTRRGEVDEKYLDESKFVTGAVVGKIGEFTVQNKNVRWRRAPVDVMIKSALAMLRSVDDGASVARPEGQTWVEAY